MTNGHTIWKSRDYIYGIWQHKVLRIHYNDLMMSTMASQIISLTIVYSAVYSDADQRKHQSSASLAFVRGIHRSLVNSLHKSPVGRKMFPLDDIMKKSSFRVKSFQNENNRQTWEKYKNKNKGKNSIENSSPLYQTYTPTVIQKHKPKITVKPNISRTRVGNKIVDHSDVVGASPVGAAPTTSSFST